MISSIQNSYSGFLKNHADVIDQTSVIILNTTILASEIFSQIPREIAAGCRTFLAYTGVISIHFQFREMWKSCQDFNIAFEIPDFNSLLYTATKVALKASDIFLTLGSFTFSLISVFLPKVGTAYYRTIMPLATASWFLLIGFEIIDTIQTKALLKKFESIDDLATKREIATHFALFQKNEPIPKQQSENLQIARSLYRQFDTYRLNSLEKSPSFEILHEHLKKRLRVTKSDLGFQVLGYISLGVNRIYPKSLLQASTMWGMSVLYFLKLLYNKKKILNSPNAK